MATCFRNRRAGEGGEEKERSKVPRRERGGSAQHWYIAMETLLHWQPTAKVSQDPRNGLGRGPRRGWEWQPSPGET